ncbi:hypothetical protein [Pseudomonas putida]|uniref:Uncharacterized protein n=1 Tax=Pseudomonas putida TaxID=303 RepID=A0A8I1ECJ0_PSEPU|nr:hypothetical protein [Pseudomonas putida]MBI6883156.1 hypothetical protein [Pseudomonas putida]
MNIRNRSEICQLEAEKGVWMQTQIRAAIPEWSTNYKDQFFFNGLYEFWSKSYHQKSRAMIRDYQLLADKLELPEGYELVIHYGSIEISKTSKHNRNGFQNLLDNTPMNSPIEPEEIWHSNWQNKEVRLVSCSFQSIKKTHAFRGDDRAAMLRQEIFMNKWLGPLGYTMRMFFKGIGNGASYLLGITHSTESPEPFIEAVTSDGYKPMAAEQEAQKRPSRKSSSASSVESADQLSAREKELLAELEVIRQKKPKA